MPRCIEGVAHRLVAGAGFGINPRQEFPENKLNIAIFVSGPYHPS
jgi:hypothetical protein